MRPEGETGLAQRGHLTMQSAEEAQVFLKQRFAQFLDAQHDNVNYHKIIEELVLRKDRRLAVDLNALRQFDSALASRCVCACPRLHSRVSTSRGHRL